MLEAKQSSGIGKTRELKRKKKSSEGKKQINKNIQALKSQGVKDDFKISRLEEQGNAGSFDQSHDVGNAKTTLIKMNKIGS